MAATIEAKAYVTVNKSSYGNLLQEISRVADEDVDEELITPGTELITPSVN
jgi:hypothetical protein